jgi:hypothetical protein
MNAFICMKKEFTLKNHKLIVKKKLTYTEFETASALLKMNGGGSEVLCKNIRFPEFDFNKLEQRPDAQ